MDLLAQSDDRAAIRKSLLTILNFLNELLLTDVPREGSFSYHDTRRHDAVHGNKITRALAQLSLAIEYASRTGEADAVGLWEKCLCPRGQKHADRISLFVKETKLDFNNWIVRRGREAVLNGLQILALIQRGVHTTSALAASEFRLTSSKMLRDVVAAYFEKANGVYFTLVQAASERWEQYVERFCECYNLNLLASRWRIDPWRGPMAHNEVDIPQAS